MIDGGTASAVAARSTVGSLLRTRCEDEVRESWIGTSPGFGAPELIGTTTVSVVAPAGNVTGSLTGVNC